MRAIGFPEKLGRVQRERHARTFHRKTSSFRDFVIRRILSASTVDGNFPRKGDGSGDGAQWTRVVEFELVAHPNSECQKIAALDYPMVDVVLKARARAALAGYLMKRWMVDCSPDHSQQGPEYSLWLRDSLILYCVESAAIALEYVPSCRKDPARG